MHVSLQQAELFYTELATRMPFRYGIATMTRLPHLLLRLEVVVDGKVRRGFTGDHLPPKWFTKDPERDIEEEVEEMLLVIRHAARLAMNLRGETPFALWQQLYRGQAEWGREKRLPPLLTNFGVALVEKAMIDGFCRGTGVSLAEAVNANALGFRLAEIHPSLDQSQPADWLPPRPLDRVFLRHTVGMGDPLREGDIPAADRLRDGLPQSLEAAIAAYGLRHFKLKISGRGEQDLERLRQIASLLDGACGGDYAVTIDGNEGFARAEDFATFAERLWAEEGLRSLRERLLFIEQPLHRAVALGPGVREVIAAVSAKAPVVIDESDAEIGSLPAALDLGYAGTSHKNCKGVFKGIANACLLAQRRALYAEAPYIMSGEDLSNVPPYALQQDLAVQALLGNESVERNGHHYFAGLSHLSGSLQEELLRAHPDLFGKSDHGFCTLAVEAGRVAMGSINQGPFGTSVIFEPAAPFKAIPL